MVKRLYTTFEQGEISVFDMGRIDQQKMRYGYSKISNLILENGILTRRPGAVGLLPSGTEPGYDRFVPGTGPLAFDGGYLYSQNGVATLPAWLTALLGHILYSHTIPNSMSDTWIAVDEGADPVNRPLLWFQGVSIAASRPGSGALPDIKQKTYGPTTFQGLWAQPILSGEVGGDVILSFLGRVYTFNRTSGALRASRTQTYNEYGKFTSGTNYAANGDLILTPSYVQKTDGLLTFAPIPPFYMDDPATTNIDESTWGQLDLSADLGIQLKGNPGTTPEYGNILWASYSDQIFFGTTKGVYMLASGFVYGPSPEAGGAIPQMIVPVPSIYATQLATPGSGGATQTVPVWGETRNTVLFLSGADEITLFNKWSRKFMRYTIGLPRNMVVDTIAWYGGTKYAVLIVDLTKASAGDFSGNYIMILDEETASRTRIESIAAQNVTDGPWTIRGCEGRGLFVKARCNGTRRSMFLNYAAAKKYTQASAMAVTDYADKVHTTDAVGVVAPVIIRTTPLNQSSAQRQDLGAFYGPKYLFCRTFDTPDVSTRVVTDDEITGLEALTPAETVSDASWNVTGNPHLHDLKIQIQPNKNQLARVELFSNTGNPFNVLAIMIETEEDPG